MNDLYEEMSINGYILLVHETEPICIIIENDIKNEQQNHVFVFDTENLIDYSLKDEKKKNISLEQQVKSLASDKDTNKQLNIIIDDLRLEKRQLEEAHNRLSAIVQSEIDEKCKALERDYEKGFSFLLFGFKEFQKEEIIKFELVN